MVNFAGSSQVKGCMFRPFASMVLLLLLTLFSSCNTDPQPPPPLPSDIQCAARSSNRVALTMDYSSEQEAWIDDLVADFNRQQKTACDGPITVMATPVGSGESMQQIVDGALHPDIWSPAGSIWLALANQMWQEKQKKASKPDCEDPACDLISTGARDTPPLAISPVVIAMWRPEAEALY